MWNILCQSTSMFHQIYNLLVILGREVSCVCVKWQQGFKYRKHSKKFLFIHLILAKRIAESVYGKINYKNSNTHPTYAYVFIFCSHEVNRFSTFLQIPISFNCNFSAGSFSMHYFSFFNRIRIGKKNRSLSEVDKLLIRVTKIKTIINTV